MARPTAPGFSSEPGLISSVLFGLALLIVALWRYRGDITTLDGGRTWVVVKHKPWWRS